MKAIKNLLEGKQETFLNELLELLRIPSISADPKYKDEMTRCADHLKGSFEALGLPEVEICPTDGHPIVYAATEQDPSRQTILVYGHYDVQPPDPLDLWDSPPFEPVIKTTDEHPDGAIYARGSCDDKGQFFMHLKALELLKETGEPLPCNV